MNDLVYHYCSSSAFESIVRNQSFWLSPLKYSNDLFEGVFAINLLKKLVMHKQGLNYSTAELDKFEKLVSESHECVGICFSKEKDLMSQWRGYAEDGHGFSVGFRKEPLAQISKSSNRLNSHEVMGLKLLEVEYDLKEQNRILDPIATKLATQKTQDEIISTLREFLQIIHSLKHESFKEEKEFRLIRWIQIKNEHAAAKIFDDVEYRLKGRQLIPYINLPFNQDAQIIEKVIIGPNNLAQVDHINNFLVSKGHRDVSVEKSKIPYR